MQTTQHQQFIQPRVILATAAMALLFGAGIFVGAAFDGGLPALGSQVAAPAGDRSYDALEEIRASRDLPTRADHGRVWSPTGGTWYTTDALEEPYVPDIVKAPAPRVDLPTGADHGRVWSATVGSWYIPDALEEPYVPDIVKAPAPRVDLPTLDVLRAN